ncbi:hypothetical protein BJX68DRAFT_274492 [Aspergillus pseudodeflectus]|uniref:rRNA adenine N(6)-methyltransferase n=1 Tax=Aspergillus pseudodeflectus TaxID=176178 RepID=A0ABR4J9G0_9EURO
MPALTRWSPLSRYPLTESLSKFMPTAGNAGKKPVFVSESLCDDILQRLSPYLLRNRPVDILDLWPGPGLFSSKINDFLKPRRHVLVEPDLKKFKDFLEPLAQSRSCYELVSTKIQTEKDWGPALLSKHFPEQGPSCTDNSGPLPRNDTLLVLASPPPPTSTKDHFTVSRWFMTLMEACLQQRQLNTYGSVRLLVSVGAKDAKTILPSLIHERQRPAILTEQAARHAFLVAATDDSASGDWAFQKQYDILRDGAARVAQRASEAGVVTPVEREFSLSTLELAPDGSLVGKIPAPYQPRIKTAQHEKYIAAFQTFDNARPESPDYDKLRRARNRAFTRLNQENRQAYARKLVVDKYAQLDELNKSISRLAADQTTKLTDFDPVIKEIEAVEESIAEWMSEHHFDTSRAVPYLVDDRLASLHSGSFDDAVLLWDRRPFEPLLIGSEEIYPRETSKCLLYFEADPNAYAARKLQQLTPEQRYIAYDALEAYTLSLTGLQIHTIKNVTDCLFPALTTNEIIKAIPSLAQYASKRPKADFDSLPKTVHHNPEYKIPPLPSSLKTQDPVYCYQENLDYDLSSVRSRVLPISTLWDLFAKYATDCDPKQHSIVQLTRYFGGTVTTARGGIWLSDE